MRERKKPPDPNIRHKNCFHELQDDCEDLDRNYSKKLKLTKRTNETSYFSRGEQEPTSQFLVMSAKNTNETLQKVSPFVVQQTVRDVASGDVNTIKRLRNGTILIETKKNKAQATRLLKLKKLYDPKQTEVNVEEHRTLNSSKAVAFCDDFTYLTDTEILDGLKEQGVIEIRRMYSRNEKGERVNSKGCMFTFKRIQPPNILHVGFLKITTRLYIPNPMRCYNSYGYNHTKERCFKDKEPICGNCTESAKCQKTIKINNNEKEIEKIVCDNKPKCVNCGDSHSAWNRKCPAFKKQYEIQKIKTEQRIPLREAKLIYRSLYPERKNENLYTAIVQTDTFSQAQTSPKEINNIEKHQTIPIQPNTTNIEERNQNSEYNITSNISQPLMPHLTPIVSVIESYDVENESDSSALSFV